MIDEAHLCRQTMGDARLADELLGMFVLQLETASREMSDASPQRRMAIAHSLKGTARSLGIEAVSECAQALEVGSDDPAPVERLSRLAALLSAEVTHRRARPG